MSENDTLLDIKDAARFLSVSETSLRRWTNSGRLACLRIGRRRERRFRRADLLAFLERPIDAGSVAGEAPVRTSTTASDADTIATGTHLCGLYGTDADRVRLAAAFLGGGLDSSTVNIVVGPRESRTAILGALEARVSSLSELVDQGRIVSTDYESSPEAQLDFFRARFTSVVRDGVRSFRVVGDLSGLAERAGPEAVARFESGYASTIARRYPVVTLCEYDVRLFTGPELLTALRGHPDTLAHPWHVV